MCSHYCPLYEGHGLRIQEEHQPSHEKSSQVVKRAIDAHINILAYNINSVNDTGQTKRRDQFSPVKFEGLTKLYFEYEIDIFMLQETRMKRSLPQNQYYNLVQSFAGKKGNGGIIIGFSKQGGGHDKRPVQPENRRCLS